MCWLQSHTDICNIIVSNCKSGNWTLIVFGIYWHSDWNDRRDSFCIAIDWKRCTINTQDMRNIVASHLAEPTIENKIYIFDEWIGMMDAWPNVYWFAKSSENYINPVPVGYQSIIRPLSGKLLELKGVDTSITTICNLSACHQIPPAKDLARSFANPLARGHEYIRVLCIESNARHLHIFVFHFILGGLPNSAVSFKITSRAAEQS